MCTTTYDAIEYTQFPPISLSTHRSRLTCEPRNEFDLDRLKKVWDHTISSLIRPLCTDVVAAATDYHEVANEIFCHQHTEKFIRLQRELIQYIGLPLGWDGFDGKHARPQAILDVLAFLKYFPEDLPIPKPMLSGSGVVGLYWDRGNYYASIEFEGDGTYTYLTDSPEGYGGEEGVAAAVLPHNLRKYIASLPGD